MRVLTKKFLMINGMFLLSLIMVCPSVVADESTNNTPTNMELLIKQVTVESDDAGDQLLIIGENFDNGYMPEVKLGDDPIPLDVFYYTSDEIVVDCPGGTCSAGDYLLTITTGPSVKNYDAYDLTIGARIGASVISRIYYVEETDSVRAECDDDGSIAIGGSAICPYNSALRRSNLLRFNNGWAARCYDIEYLDLSPVTPLSVTAICIRP